jgi:hypothetical protein
MTHNPVQHFYSCLYDSRKQLVTALENRRNTACQPEPANIQQTSVSSSRQQYAEQKGKPETRDPDKQMAGDCWLWSI